MSTLLLPPKEARAANFGMQTGYYMGTGVTGLAITGLGFQPSFVMIKSTTAAGVAVFKTSAMAAAVTAYTSATADNAATNITLDSDGFTLGTLVNVNSVNVMYHWVAFSGSDCSATGNFCVGTYTGNGVSPRTITIGFQPSFVMAKRSTAVAGHFRTASEPANETSFLTTTARDVAGNYIRSFTATGFIVGATDNVNTGTYYYVAFKTTAGSMFEGTYTGNNTDNRNIAGVGFQANFMLVKNATSATAGNRDPLMNFSESYGEGSDSIGSATALQIDSIQDLQANGFQIGLDAQVNQNAQTFYYVSFGGASNPTSSGSYTMQNGSYTGNGAVRSISGLGFQPDLVIIKGITATQGVFRTKMMKGDSTAYLSNAVANLANSITSLNADGFSLGTDASVNTNGTVYHWQAFGNAFDPYDDAGSGEFAVGAYYANAIDSRNITRLPFQPDMVTIKRNGASAGTWRSTANTGDSSSFFGASAEAADYVQALNADGFQVGLNAAVNSSTNIHYWFAFKTGTNFNVGSYTGNATARNITGLGIRPETVWIKRSTAVNGVFKPVSLSGDSTQYFTNLANVTNRITGFVKGGFSLGTSTTEANLNTATYRYAAWSNPNYSFLSVDIVDATGTSVASPSFSMNNVPINFLCTNNTGIFGTSAQKIRVYNFSSAPKWSMSIAATSGATDLWRNTGDTRRYDFNESSGSPTGCSDGADTDSVAGKLNVNASGATITPETGCTTSNVSLGSSANFDEGVTDSVVLASTNISADADCYWDITDINLDQIIPPEQAIDSYNLGLTVSIVAT